jgi:hypothetical protein
MAIRIAIKASSIAAVRSRSSTQCDPTKQLRLGKRRAVSLQRFS